MVGVDRLIELIKNVSLVRLKQHSQTAAIEISSIPSVQSVYGHWMVLILLSGPSAKITFKSHFKTGAAQAIGSQAFDLAPQDLSLQRALDFMREFCNLTAGGVKLALSSRQVHLALSLPVITRGFDEIFFEDVLQPTSRTDQWKFNFSGGEVVCSVTIDSMDDLNLADLDIDFLEKADSTIEIF